MRFFTLAWWRGDSEEDAGAQYLAHLETIRSRLTPSLVDLLYPQTPDGGLHDARLRDLQVDMGAQSLVLRLKSHDGRLDLTLTYEGVTALSFTGDPKAGLRGPHGFGDLGYHEVDVGPVGGFEHRVLFSSGIEMRVQFADACISRQSVVA